MFSSTFCLSSALLASRSWHSGRRWLASFRWTPCGHPGPNKHLAASCALTNAANYFMHASNKLVHEYLNRIRLPIGVSSRSWHSDLISSNTLQAPWTKQPSRRGAAPSSVQGTATSTWTWRWLGRGRSWPLSSPGSRPWPQTRPTWAARTAQRPAHSLYCSLVRYAVA